MQTKVFTDTSGRDVRQWTDIVRSQTARRIMDVALGLFYLDGARATTVRQITKACGMTTGALYNHFESKEELLHAIIADRHLWVESRLVLAQNAVLGDPKAELYAMVSEFLHLHVPGQRAIHVANREYGVLTGNHRDDVVNIRRRIRDRLANTLSAGSAAGDFVLPGGPSASSAKIMAIDILEMCISINAWYIEGQGVSSELLIQRYENMAMRLVLASPAADKVDF